MKFGLENISRLCAALGHPERAFPSVIVGGTNGKGSVCAMTHRALTAAGHHAARYTSPHLERLEERYVVGDREVAATDLESAVGTVLEAADSLVRTGASDAPMTFFECATAAAFVLFRDARIDVAVLEVGLGGRLDATNVVTPIAAAITSIALDHQAQLGDTLEAIAWEKAGIIKPGVPVVRGEMPAGAARVIETVAAERGARVVRARDCVALPDILAGGTLALRGGHQEGNAQVAACLLGEIDAAGIAVDGGAIRRGLTDVAWPGRLERFAYDGADVLLDAAHNPDGARALARYLIGAELAPVTLVFGAMQDKDVAAMLAELAPACEAIICTTADSPRAMAAEALGALASSTAAASWSVSAVPSPEAALRAAAHRSSRIVVAGSIFLIGPLRGILRRR